MVSIAQLSRLFGRSASVPVVDTKAPYTESLSETVEKFLRTKVARNKPTTQRAYATALSQFLEFVSDYLGERDLSFVDITPALIEDFKATWCERYKIATAAQRVNIVKTFTKWAAAKCGDCDPGEDVSIVHVKLTEFLGLSDEQYDALQCVLEKLQNPQQRFTVELLLGTGLRNDEVCNIRCSQLDPDLNWLFDVACKGSKRRDIGIGHIRASVERFLAWRKNFPMNPTSRLLWSGKDAPINNRTIWRWFHEPCMATEIIPKTLAHPHTARHTFAFRTLPILQRRNPGDPMRAVIELRDLMGHTDVKTTFRYLGNEQRRLWAYLKED